MFLTVVPRWKAAFSPSVRQITAYTWLVLTSYGRNRKCTAHYVSAIDGPLSSASFREDADCRTVS